MAKRIYSEEFRIDAVNQVIENGYSVPDTAQIGVHLSSLNSWIRHLKSPEAIAKHQKDDIASVEIKKLQKELKRVTEERDILKKAAVYFEATQTKIYFYKGV